MLSTNDLLDGVFEELGIDAPDPARAPIPDPVDWIETNFYIPETNAPIQLMPYQRAVVREALSTTNGLFNYSFILWSDIKKSAKSTIAGAISLYLAWHHAWETVRVVANDLKQADSRTFFYIERAIKMNPEMAGLCKINNYEITLPNHTTIHAIPVDPKGEAGGGDLVTTFTEMWAMKSKAAQTLWSETTLSPLKYGRSLRIGESYAGYNGDSPILETLYETGVKNGQQIDISHHVAECDRDKVSGLEIYRNGRMLALWNTKPRCSWQTDEYYIQEAGSLTPSEFNRLHRNQWSETTEAFIPIDWWKACKVDSLPPQDRRSVVIGVDAAVENDCFAVVAVGRIGMKVQVRECKIWYPPKNGQINLADVETELLRLFKQYAVIEVAYDPYQMASMAQRLRGNVFWKPFLQGAPRLVADKRLYDMIRDRQVEHLDEFPELTQHIINADRKPEDSDKLRIIKRTQQGKIDAVIAMSMSVDRIMTYNL